jgi:hypothetical protein
MRDLSPAANFHGHKILPLSYCRSEIKSQKPPAVRTGSSQLARRYAKVRTQRFACSLVEITSGFHP